METLDILGFGLIGRQPVKRARGFCPKSLYNKNYRLSESEEKELGVEYGIIRAADQVRHP